MNMLSLMLVPVLPAAGGMIVWMIWKAVRNHPLVSLDRTEQAVPASKPDQTESRLRALESIVVEQNSGVGSNSRLSDEIERLR